jgi:tetratricopeptide (TPR) repeat protein
LTDEDPNYLNELLAWTTCAQRPLKLGELETVLKLKSEDGEGMFYLERMLRKQYASFFSLIRDDGLSTADLQNSRGIPVDSDSDREIEEGYDDIENDTDFHSNPSTTEVTLSHASIGDFFRNPAQGKVSAGDNYPMIGVNFNEAEISVLKTCLNLFCDEGLRDKAKGSSSLLPYATKNWQHHLRATDPLKASQDDCREIAGLLAKMFRSELFMKSWASEVTRSFFTEDNVKMFRKWLDYKDIRNYLPTEDKEWIESSADAPTNTFLPLARYIAQRWLHDEWWIPHNCCWIVYAFINLQKGTPLTEPPSSGLNTAQEILDVAEWAQLEKTARWHRRLGIVFRDRGMYDDALQHFTKSLEIDDTMWLARAGISRLHIAKEEYEQAILLDKINEEVLQKMLVTDPDNSTQTKANLHVTQERISECYYLLKDKKSALEYRQKAFGNKGRCDDCICICLDYLTEEKRYQDIIDMLKSMEDNVPDKEYSRLTESLWQNPPMYWDFFIQVVHAAHETSQLAFLIDAYCTAIAAAKKELKTVTACWLEICLAWMYYRYRQDEERAINIWEKIMRTFPSSKLETEMGEIKDITSISLARHWFQAAREAEKGSLLAQRYVDKLERLAKSKVQTTSVFISTNTPSIILGLWYRLDGRLEEARACFQPHIREALQILSDDDPDNDGDGYRKLSHVFLAAGDDKNAIAILQAIGPWEIQALRRAEGGDRGEKEEPNAEDSDLEDLEICFCDGPCRRSFENYIGIAACRYCYDVDFCGDCLKMLKEGNMPLNVCSAKHEWLVVPPLEEKVKVGELVMDGKIVSLDDWKKEIKS